MTKGIEHRKRDHLILAQDRSLNFSISAGFDRWRFIHNALPEIDLEEVDTSTNFLGKRLSLPLLISSMSGGVQESFLLNAALAVATETAGCALGLGSIRAAIEDKSLQDSFLIARENAPNAVILANIGISQIIKPGMMDPISAFCQKLQADGLFIHLNSLQEAFQPEGETRFKGAIDAIALWVKEFSLPIIVKEVGQGLSVDVIQRLEQAGVKHIDVAGAGGSNWINIERQRLGAGDKILKSAATAFSDWGEPTAGVLAELNTDVNIIASGGIRSAMDMAKSLALGAQMVGVAGPFLKAGLSADPHDLIEELQVWQKTLEVIMFGTGLSKISELIGNRSILTGCQPITGCKENSQER